MTVEMDRIPMGAGAPITASRFSVRIQAVQTGRVRVRRRQIEGEGPVRMVRTMLDRTWSPWLPIYSWLIEHPEGLILVDTGETAQTASHGYLPRWHPYYRVGVEFDVQPEQEVGPQLRRRGYDPADVRTVVMTHLHTDHAGGLAHFPNSDILLTKEEISATAGILGRVRGYLPHRWPGWFQPREIAFTSGPYGPFDRSASLTQAEDVLAVPTPGHSSGHMSVIVRAGELHYFLAGDTSYTESLMLAGKIDGVAPDGDLAYRTLSRIRHFVTETPTVYLPSHDPESGVRLEHRQTVDSSVR